MVIYTLKDLERGDMSRSISIKIKLILIFMLICFSLWLTANGIIYINKVIYTPEVYDCSNMCTDQAALFAKIGIDTDIAVNGKHRHTWLIIKTPIGDIDWETTSMTVELD